MIYKYLLISSYSDNSTNVNAISRTYTSMVNLFTALPTSLGEYTDILEVASGECIDILMVASETKIKRHHNHF